MSRHIVLKEYNTVAGNSTTTVVLTPNIDVSKFEKFCLGFQNNNAFAFLDLQVQGALDSSGTAANTAPNFIQIDTATLLQPSALAATATVYTVPVDNCFKWIRLVGKTNGAAPVGSVRLIVGGHSR